MWAFGGVGNGKGADTCPAPRRRPLLGVYYAFTSLRTLCRARSRLQRCSRMIVYFVDNFTIKPIPIVWQSVAFGDGVMVVQTFHNFLPKRLLFDVVLLALVRMKRKDRFQ